MDIEKRRQLFTYDITKTLFVFPCTSVL